LARRAVRECRSSRIRCRDRRLNVWDPRPMRSSPSTTATAHYDVMAGAASIRQPDGQ
jgi:hypothetical protein